MSDEKKTPDLPAWIVPALKQVSMGSIMGFCTGAFAKKLGEKVAYAVGGLFVLIQLAAYNGYLNVNWKKMERDAIAAVDVDGDGKITEVDIKHYWGRLVTFLTFQLPSASGFL
eukprot:CAMPEP_0115021946 /NCGR_PEP_ID=MMETSP0216-20121206/31215_1 /TAXON_ID=223996 /ORGANISM="Protocruzia adherens, Strain Boccale" /LENGTH=112 /DNA_ID=CAMNT_0002394451 /DNA_START=38 /DNA_END=372 /DNA_ORIENTATION=+